MSDVHDIAALDAQLDPDGSIASVLDAVHRPHDWIWCPVLELSQEEAERLVRTEDGTSPLRRASAGKVKLAGGALMCRRCQLPWERMTEVERERCRGGE